MAKSSYRQKFIKHNPGVHMPGWPGWWYRCAICGNWCARPGTSGVTFPPQMKMEVDHILPWSLGGDDSLANLQPTCMICNRMKGNQCDAIDLQKAAFNKAMCGQQLKLKKRRKKRADSSTGN